MRLWCIWTLLFCKVFDSFGPENNENYFGRSKCSGEIITSNLCRIKRANCEEQISLCEDGWKQFHAGCYYVDYSQELNYYEAKAVCKAFNASLTSVTSAEEDKFIETLVTGLQYWLGVQQIAFRKWIWDDTKRVVEQYNRWPSNLPATSDQCVYANFNGKWGETDCRRRNPYRGFVCKKNYTAYCDSGWTNFWSACYIYHSESVRRNTAKKNCVRYHKASLTSILSSEEEQFLSDFTKNKGYWTGLMYVHNRWIWDNYEYPKYTNWSYADDIMDLIGTLESYMFVRNGWVSSNGNTARVGYVCKKPAKGTWKNSEKDTSDKEFRSLVKLFGSGRRNQEDSKRVVLILCIVITAMASYCGTTAAWKISNVISKRRAQKLLKHYSSLKHGKYRSVSSAVNKRQQRRHHRRPPKRRHSTELSQKKLYSHSDKKSRSTQSSADQHLQENSSQQVITAEKSSLSSESQQGTAKINQEEIFTNNKPIKLTDEIEALTFSEDLSEILAPIINFSTNAEIRSNGSKPIGSSTSLQSSA